ncbi:Uncharacterised protein [Mycobacteroides abscessus subsp. abscessus]|nr:Uncharacterised protein [Mycobacteroides abscessus subsp. abscessus]
MPPGKAEGSRRISGSLRIVLLAADPAAGGLVGDADIAYVTDRAAGARVHRLSGVGHGLQLQDPRQVAEALRDHLRPAR